jgi:fatty-acid peroxygenase
MAKIPQDRRLDSSLALLREGYTFIHQRCISYQTDIFQMRLLGQRVICLHGQEAAAVFYNPDYFIRKRAIPKAVQKTLLGENGVQTLDDLPHRRRKEIFMSLMSRENIQKLMDLMRKEWEAYINKWEKQKRVVLFDEVQEIMCRAACGWAGVPLKEKEVRKRASEFGFMVDAFGAIGPRNWRGRWARRRTEKWIRGIIKDIRKGKLEAPAGTPAHALAMYHDFNGKPMDRQMAAVELINILRPIVAIATYVTFGALALHDYPVYRDQLKAGEDGFTELFVQEVRRVYPFTPFLGARVRMDFGWKGYHFRKGTLVFLDVFGTLHDKRLWERPMAFDPERFRNWQGSPFDFIPQGGGSFMGGHRCAGEWITIEAMKLSLNYLTKAIRFEVPDQDLRYSLSRMPTLPKSRFILKRVKRTGTSVPVEEIPVHRAI